MADIVVNGNTSGAVTLSAPAVAGTVTVTLPATSGTMLTTASSTGVSGSAISSGTVAEAYGGTGTSTGYYGFKNRIINGAMVIDQRNAGAVYSMSASAYTLDRWLGYLSQVSKYTVQQTPSTTEAGFAVRVAAGFTNYLGVTSSSAYSITTTDQFFISQTIEGYNIADLAWGTANAASITISFWVRSSLTGLFGGALSNNGASRNYPFSFTINSANTWEQKTITVAGDTSGTWLTNNGVGLRINFNLGTGATYSATAGAWTGTSFITAPTGATSVVGTNGATFYITGVQLEKGSTATSFDYRPYGTEMQLCQRYYWKLCGSTLGGSFLPMVLMNATSTTNLSGCIQLPVRARVAPTSITLGGSAPSISGGTISTNMTLDRSAVDEVLTYVLGTGFTAYYTYRWLGNADATTFLGFEGMEL